MINSNLSTQGDLQRVSSNCVRKPDNNRKYVHDKYPEPIKRIIYIYSLSVTNKREKKGGSHISEIFKNTLFLYI